MFEIVVTTAGVIAGRTLAKIHSRQLMLLFYHFPFYFIRPYLYLYDRLESQYTYELLGGGERFKSYKAFQSIFQDKRTYVTEQFRSLWGVYAKQVGRDYGLVLLVALGLFWSVFWAFIVPFLLIQTVAFLHVYFVKKYRADFFASLMVSLLLER